VVRARADTLLSWAVLALAAHGAAYRTFLPRDGMHGYLGWYEPIIGILSLLALAYLAVVAWRVVRSRQRPRVHEAAGPLDARRRIVSLASGGLTLLVVQETIERSVAERTVAIGGFTPLSWLVVLAVALAGAGVLVLLRRGYELLELRLSGRVPAGSRASAPVMRPAEAEPLRRGSPLAHNGALRGPPLLASL
jgi:hypothetical protein